LDRKSQIEYLRELAFKIRDKRNRRQRKSKDSLKRWLDLKNKTKPDRLSVWLRPAAGRIRIGFGV